MTRVSIGMIGVGFMGGRWARALAEHPGATLAVVSDVREELGREVAERLGARYVRDPLEAAADAALQGVVVCTPEHLHSEPTGAALDAGKAVAVEKPLAHSVMEAERIASRAEELGLPLLAGHILRFEPRYAAVAAAIGAGEIGAVQSVRNERIGVVGDQTVLQGRTSIPLYYGVHEFDLARWYAGEVARVYAERSDGVLRARGFDIDDLYSAVVGFRSGAHGTATLGWSLPDTMPGYGMGGVTVIGERGVLRVSQGDVGILKVDQARAGPVDVYYAPEVHGRLWGALAIEVDHFVACVRGDAEPLCTARDGCEAVRVSLAMEESAESGRVIELSSNPSRTEPGG